MFYLSDKKEAKSVYIVPEMSYRCWSLLTESGQLCSMKPRDPRVFARRKNITRVKCKQDVICYFEKGCFTVVVRAVRRLRTDEIVFCICEQLLDF